MRRFMAGDLRLDAAALHQCSFAGRSLCSSTHGWPEPSGKVRRGCHVPDRDRVGAAAEKLFVKHVVITRVGAHVREMIGRIAVANRAEIRRGRGVWHAGP
jgi:hypothetical protein